MGAGMAGLTAGRWLQEQGYSVVLVDKGRGVGGRLATRRIGEQRFDHGAQYFTAQSEEFRRAVDSWREAGVVRVWFSEAGRPRYIARQGMNSLGKHLAAGLEVQCSAQVSAIEWADGAWRVVAASGGGEEWRARALLLTPPMEQSLALLNPVLSDEERLLLPTAAYLPCFALMAVLSDGPGLPEPGYLRIERGPIAWIADNTRKGICSGPAAYTVHATAEFSQRHFDIAPDRVANVLLEAARPWTGGAVQQWQLHRWRYSLVSQTASRPSWLATRPGPVALAGDGFGGPRVEGAFLSGLDAARSLHSLLRG